MAQIGDDTKLSELKRELPAQAISRKQWTLDAFRNNQGQACEIILSLINKEYDWTRAVFNTLKKHDQDGLLQENGLLTDRQIKVLKRITSRESG